MVSRVLEPGNGFGTLLAGLGAHDALGIGLDVLLVIGFHLDAFDRKIINGRVNVVDHEVQDRMFRRMIVIGLIDEDRQAAAGEMQLKAYWGLLNLQTEGLAVEFLGLAHVAELDTIEDADERAVLEERALRLGRALVLNRKTLGGMDRVVAMARQMEMGGKP